MLVNPCYMKRSLSLKVLRVYINVKIHKNFSTPHRANLGSSVEGGRGWEEDKVDNLRRTGLRGISRSPKRSWKEPSLHPGGREITSQQEMINASEND